jgi:hypothetical protein
MHFRDKDELLVSGIHDMLRTVHSTGLPSTAARHDKLISFSLPIFEYHDQHRHTDKDRMGTKGRAIVHEHLRRVLTSLIAEEVGQRGSTAAKNGAAASARTSRPVHRVHIHSRAGLVAGESKLAASD